MSTPTPFQPQEDFDVGALYAGQYVKADDLGGKTYAASIAAVETVEIAGQDGSVRRKAAVTLQGWPAKLALNKTNFEAIAAVYGRRSAGWIGKSIEVYPDTTLFGGRSVPCLRVRVPRPGAPTAAVPGNGGSGPAPTAPAVTQAQVAETPPSSTDGKLTDDIPY